MKEENQVNFDMNVSTHKKLLTLLHPHEVEQYYKSAQPFSDGFFLSFRRQHSKVASH